MKSWDMIVREFTVGPHLWVPADSVKKNISFASGAGILCLYISLRRVYILIPTSNASNHNQKE